ncbi:MAG: OmpH family outer membrane protein [Candidatus Eisenbacteria bacterium]|nr:OmpH family outer membrane protein [Candidatus Eisenbacteria bacterium]
MKTQTVRTGARRILVLATAILSIPAGIAAADMKIGYIDSARIFAEYKGTEDAQRSFDQEVAAWEQQAQQMKAELDSLHELYQSQSLMLSDAKKAERQQEIAAKQAEYETFVQSVFGPQGRVAEKNGELVRPIVDKINLVLQVIGDDEGFTIVLDAAVGGIVYAADGLDLTDRVLEELNKGLE